MERITDCFDRTIPESSCDIEGELTVVVDENGQMVLDITETLSNFTEQNKEDDLVIITTDETGVVDSSNVTYTVLQGETNGSSSTSQTANSYDVSDSLIASLQVPTSIPAINTDESPFSNIPDVINSASAVYIPEGQIVFIMGGTAQQGKPSQIPTIATQVNAREETKTSSSRRVRRLLPKPLLNNPNDTTMPTTLTQKKRQKRKNASMLYEVCLLNPESIITTGEGPTSQKFFVCDKCPSTEELVKFRRFEEFSRHYGRIHHLRVLKNASVFCREESCSFKSSRVEDLRKHLNLIHGFAMEAQTHTFTSMEEFEAWKMSEEKLSGSKFNRSSGRHQTRQSDTKKAVVYMYYACNRSGLQRIRESKGSKKKKPSSQGSIKINGTCTASISLVHDKELNRISCDYCPTHYGHDTKEPHRQNLSKQEKLWILQLLARGWNSDEIVKTLRSGTITGTTVRMMAVTRQDVFNVCRSHGVTNLERRDPDDSKSVKLWVEELESKSSVLIWNPGSRVLLLAVMNDNQVVLARLHARIIYVTDISINWDRCHRLLGLSILSTSDNEAYLIAYAITDQNGLEPLQEVFAAIHAKLGQTFQPDFILCHDPSTVADAWISRSDAFPTFLTPLWNVENEWAEARTKYIDDDLKREAVKKCLDILLGETDPSKFATFFQLVNGMLAADESLLEFSRFFTDNYEQLAAHWPGFHALPDCTPLQRLNVELELIARRCRSLKRLDKCIYSLEFLTSNQPFRPMTEFRSSSQNESEICSLRRAIAIQMKTLERVAHECDSVDTLKRINEAIGEALQSKM
ncbi:uncharacterized protein LOC130696035 [Daphnia carinata]|uniref:uncharacterized protein LOC130696035 n=1 Tax=Daphnia carinata TaxID=120202 RepID=UPI00257B2C2B|nr:uncharacterized protein LOC130696035 [Daphnia carinata]